MRKRERQTDRETDKDIQREGEIEKEIKTKGKGDVGWEQVKKYTDIEADIKRIIKANQRTEKWGKKQLNYFLPDNFFSKNQQKIKLAQLKKKENVLSNSFLFFCLCCHIKFQVSLQTCQTQPKIFFQNVSYKENERVVLGFSGPAITSKEQKNFKWG